EARLRELVETGSIAELEELESEVQPELVGLGRLVGLSPRRMVDLGRALGVRSAAELREAAREGSLRQAPGIGPSTEAKIVATLGLPFVPPELREGPRRGGALQTLVERRDIRGDLHCHTLWSDGKASVLEMGRAARDDHGYDYIAICDHTVSVRVVPGLDADAVRRQGEEIALANEELAPFRILRGIECDILNDRTLALPDDVLG